MSWRKWREWAAQVAVLHPVVLETPDTHAACRVIGAELGIVGVDQCKALFISTQGWLTEKGAPTCAAGFAGCIGFIRKLLTWTSLGYRRGFWVYRCW